MLAKNSLQSSIMFDCLLQVKRHSCHELWKQLLHFFLSIFTFTRLHYPGHKIHESSIFKGFLSPVLTLLLQNRAVKQPSLETGLTFAPAAQHWQHWHASTDLANDGCLHRPLIQTTCIKNPLRDVVAGWWWAMFSLPWWTGRDRQIDKGREKAKDTECRWNGSEGEPEMVRLSG